MHDHAGREPAVDLNNCDREPIHLLGNVQPFGFLLAVSPKWTVTHASANIGRFLDTSAEKAIGQKLDALFSRAAMQTVQSSLQTAMVTESTARAFNVPIAGSEQGFDLAVYMSGNSIVVECEPSVQEPDFNSMAVVRSMVSRLQQTTDMRSLCRVAAREVRTLTGFDRVMIYRFDHDGSGEVVAEAARQGLPSYLGLHYPASDIPRQARLLYERNWLRIIADIGSVPSPILANGRDGATLDLSMSVLRSVSPIHIEYLRNMGVSASLSVSILRDGKLWGLVACHHYAPRHLSFERRTASELFGQMFSLILESRERAAEIDYETRASQSHNQLVRALATESGGLDTVAAHIDRIADLIPCDGAGAWLNGKPVLTGMAPNGAEFTGLVSHLDGLELGGVHHTHEIGAAYAPAQNFADRAAGILVIPLSRPARDYVVLFRREVARSVSWAGDPTKPVSLGPLGDRLTPRKSFELWQETVRGQGIPWSSAEVRMAESLRVNLLEVILRLNDEAEKDRKFAQQRQELLIAELNHRVRNILGLVRGLIAQSNGHALTVEEFISVIGGRIQALALAHDQLTADQWTAAPVSTLLMTEAAAYLGKKSDRVRLTGEDVTVTPQAFTTLALVFHELVTNSAKYGALSDSRGGIDVETRRDADGRLQIDWREHGGPPVAAPTRRGFGTTIIERSIPHGLQGETNIDYALSGVRVSITIPGSHVVSSEPLAASTVREAENRSRVAAADASSLQNVLLVEDNLIIALDAEHLFENIGAKQVHTASNVGHAMSLLETVRPDFALLDVNLGEETSFPIADRLLELRVPFAFATGYGERMNFPASLRDIPKLIKPYSIDSMRALVADFLNRKD